MLARQICYISVKFHVISQSTYEKKLSIFVSIFSEATQTDHRSLKKKARNSRQFVNSKARLWHSFMKSLIFRPKHYPNSVLMWMWNHIVIYIYWSTNIQAKFVLKSLFKMCILISLFLILTTRLYWKIRIIIIILNKLPRWKIVRF